MAAVCFLLATVVFAVDLFGGRVGNLDLIALGLTLVALGLTLGAGAVSWVRSRV